MDFMEEYVAAGFDITKAPEVINEALTYRHNDCPVTLDISDVDLNLLNELHTYGAVRNMRDRRKDLYELKKK